MACRFTFCIHQMLISPITWWYHQLFDDIINSFDDINRWIMILTIPYCKNTIRNELKISPYHLMIPVVLLFGHIPNKFDGISISTVMNITVIRPWRGQVCYFGEDLCGLCYPLICGKECSLHVVCLQMALCKSII